MATLEDKHITCKCAGFSLKPKMIKTHADGKQPPLLDWQRKAMSLSASLVWASSPSRLSADSSGPPSEFDEGSPTQSSRAKTTP